MPNCFQVLFYQNMVSISPTGNNWIKTLNDAEPFLIIRFSLPTDSDLQYHLGKES